ncbi:MAG: DUF4298 domain-containing protein [Clostridia bacterium]|nr:DUF4298 domain-containing protein [Clostridia bacterium]MBR7062720.1 DUF4298 domain-containing protein [Clostridia bacterium]
MAAKADLKKNVSVTVNGDAVKRVKKMEAAMNRVARAGARLERALEEFRAREKDIDALKTYLAGDWRQDFEADERGEFPKDLRRGVLSEDALYDTLSDADRLNAEIKKRRSRGN